MVTMGPSSVSKGLLADAHNIFEFDDMMDMIQIFWASLPNEASEQKSVAPAKQFFFTENEKRTDRQISCFSSPLPLIIVQIGVRGDRAQNPLLDNTAPFIRFQEFCHPTTWYSYCFIQYILFNPRNTVSFCLPIKNPIFSAKSFFSSLD